MTDKETTHSKQSQNDDEGSKKTTNGDQKKTSEQTKPEPLSEEDVQLQEELLLLVERLEDTSLELSTNAVELLKTKIKSSTSSMTSVPKPLKFLMPHYQRIENTYLTCKDEQLKKWLADVLSVLGMTIGEKRDCLKYRLLGSSDSIPSWGHEYVRHLSGEIQLEYHERVSQAESGMPSEDFGDLLDLVHEIVAFNMEHNAECDSCDLLMEVDQLELLDKYVEEEMHGRVCLYLSSCVDYVAEPENTRLLEVAVSLFRKFNNYPPALRLALKLNDNSLIEDIFRSCSEILIQKQLCFMLGRQQMFLEIDDSYSYVDDPEELNAIISNAPLNQHFLYLARELDIMEPKLPDDIMKNHADQPSNTQSVESTRINLASFFVNGFVNCAFGKDKLIMNDVKNIWLNKTRDSNLITSVASLGLIMLWDVDMGLSHIDRYLYSQDKDVKAGALLAAGIVNCAIRNDCDPAMAILGDNVTDNAVDLKMRVASILGLGLAYAGSANDIILSKFETVLSDDATCRQLTNELVGVTSLSVGLVALGSCRKDLAELLIGVFKHEVFLINSTYNRYILLAIGLLYLGKQKRIEEIEEVMNTLPDSLKLYANILLEVCAYTGTGNVLKIQQMLHHASEFFIEEEKEKDKDKDKDGDKKDPAGQGALHEPGAHQAPAVLGIALIAMGEEIGAEMSLRTFGHLIQYGDSVSKRTVPLALALISASNPQLPVLDMLSKLSHDNETETAYNAIMALGIVGAGTNNSRLANILKQLASYYYKETNCLYLVRLAQGLLHLGKGTLTLNPYHSDRGLMTPVAVGGLLTVLISLMDAKNTLIVPESPSYLLYCLAPAIQPRMLVTLDTNLEALYVNVRVGQAIDVVGQAGRPKSITGFQTHTTPVLLAYGERAELTTEEYIPLSPVLEGFVILKKNPKYAV